MADRSRKVDNGRKATAERIGRTGGVEKLDEAVFAGFVLGRS